MIPMSTGTRRVGRPRDAVRSAVLLWIAAALSLLLTGCGGSDTPAEPPPAPLFAPPSGENLMPTNRAMDVGLVGDGLIATQDPATGEPRYTRYGRLDIDANGRLIDSDGQLVRGVPGNADASLVARAGALPAIPLSMGPKATTIVRLGMNLDANADFVLKELDFSDPSTYNLSTHVFIYDELGNPQSLNFFFRHRSRMDWEVQLAVNGRRVVGAMPIELRFGTDGRLIWAASTLAATIDIPTEFGPARAMRGVVVALGGTTQFGANFSMESMSQDGYPSGVFGTSWMTPEGQLMGVYSNGQERYFGTIVLARFTVADRLQRTGERAWICGRQCTPPALGRVGDARMPVLAVASLNILN